MPRMSAEALRLAGYEVRGNVAVPATAGRAGTVAGRAQQPRRRGGSHKAEVEAIRRFVRAHGGECYVLHQVGRLRGSAGLPDLFLMFPALGLATWFEVKVGRDRLSTHQWGFIEQAARCGVGVLVGDVEVLIGWYECQQERCRDLTAS